MQNLQEVSNATEIPVGMAEMRVTNHPDSCLTTQLLGSGIAVAIYDPAARVGGMLHFLLPNWEISKKSAMENPALFANSGIPQLYRRCYKLGAEKERLACYLVGGGDVMDQTGNFKLGQDNRAAAVDILSKNGVTVTGEWTGKTECRMVRLFIGDGRLVIKSNTGDEFGT